MHSYNSILVHCVFATKERRPLISSDIRPRLWEYLGGTARQLGFKALAIGGTADHVHLLLSVPAKVALATAVQKLKANSSRWAHESLNREFSWQEGYGGFSVGVSQQADTVAYINHQEQHHRRVDFGSEFEAFLKKHGMELYPEDAS
jgi:putative transposase